MLFNNQSTLVNNHCISTLDNYALAMFVKRDRCS